MWEHEVFYRRQTNERITDDSDTRTRIIRALTTRQCTRPDWPTDTLLSLYMYQGVRGERSSCQLHRPNKGDTLSTPFQRYRSGQSYVLRTGLTGPTVTQVNEYAHVYELEHGHGHVHKLYKTMNMNVNFSMNINTHPTNLLSKERWERVREINKESLLMFVKKTKSCTRDEVVGDVWPSILMLC